jgi:hypothetical protein
MITQKEKEIHEAIQMNLNNLLDKIDLVIFHLKKSNFDYKDYTTELLKYQFGIKNILENDFNEKAIKTKTT